jgi:SET domain-containing protein
MSGYQFTFRVDGKKKFQCKVTSEQCTVIKPDGSQCKRKCCIGSPYCYVHLLHNKHLRIKTSALENSGKGLFALDLKADGKAIIFRKGSTIIEYEGEVIDDEELEDRYGPYTAPYAVKSKNDSNVDCACERGVGSNANTYPNHNNATFSINRKKNEVKIVATKHIHNDEEIFLSYGRSYKLNEPTESETVYRKAPRKKN